VAVVVVIVPALHQALAAPAAMVAVENLLLFGWNKIIDCFH
jgi:hypothetical protein